MQPASMIECHGVGKRYPGGREALREVSFRVGPGEFVFVTGHSGAGKSTLLKLVALLERPTSGRVVVAGRSLDRLPRREVPAHRRAIGMIFQEGRLLPERTVYENVALPLELAGCWSAREIRHRVRTALERVGLAGKERCRPVELSGGEQQRVGIARAVVHRPRLLLADEPTGNLDPAMAWEIMGLFLAFHRAGVTVLVATHDPSLIRRLGGRVLTLQEGQLVDDAWWPVVEGVP